VSDNPVGDLTVVDVNFRNGGGSDDDYGGAIYNEDVMTVTDSSFRGNGAGYGGAIYDEATATLTGDTFFGNDAYDGGEPYDDYEATLRGDTFQENTADYGAGIYFDGSTLTVDDSHVFNNAASSGGGGIYNDKDGDVTLHHAWVFGNVPDNCEPTGTIAGCFG
jgi:hypothetical protein